MRQSFEFYSTENIIFGNHSIRNLNKALNRFEGKNLLIITDQGIKKAGLLNQVTEVLDPSFSVSVYDQAVPEPPVHSAVDCYEFARTKETDIIIGLGGGSSIDLAKVVALLLQHGGHPTDYFGGENQVPGPIAPLIAIPTTAGTGSEVTSVAVLTDTENGIKIGISDNYLRPAVAICDPVLTINLPAYVTACSGIDAFSHAVEAYTAKDFKYIQAEGELLFQGSNPISDALAIQAITYIATSLPLAVQQGTNLEARGNMMLGSLLAGMAFSNAGTALAHALAYPIGGKAKSPHGELTGLLLPYVMDYNAAVIQDKLVEIAKAFLIDTSAMTREEAAAAAIDATFALLETIGLPTSLSAIGVEEKDFPEIAEKACKIDRLVRNNPRVPTVQSLINLLQEAL